MEKCEDNNDISSAIFAFDTLYTNNHMKILKMLLPYIDSKHQKLLCIYIKWQEFLITINLFKHYSVTLYNADFTNKKNLDFNNIILLLLPYCTEKEKELLKQFQQMQNMMQMMEGIKEYLPLIQQFISSDSQNETPLGGLGNIDNLNILDMLKNFLTEDQLAMFSMFINNNE